MISELNWDFSKLFAASAFVITQVSVSFMKTTALITNRWGQKKKKASKGHGSLITPPHFGVSTHPSESRTAILWMTNPQSLMGENFVPAKQSWKDLHEPGVIKISQPTSQRQVKSKYGNQQNWSYDKSTRLTEREWVRSGFHRLQSCGSMWESKRKPPVRMSHAYCFDELSSLWEFLGNYRV